jgi:hypothetical protein
VVEELDLDSIWYQVIVNDLEGLSGASVVAFIEPIIRKVGATAVVTSDLQGACPGLKDHEGRVLLPDDFLQKVANATQYDWAFFFLYSKAPTPHEADVTDERKAMWHADLTVRLADDYYFYVYSRDQKLMADLRRMQPNAEYKVARFEDLDIPD